MLRDEPKSVVTNKSTTSDVGGLKGQRTIHVMKDYSVYGNTLRVKVKEINEDEDKTTGKDKKSTMILKTFQLRIFYEN